MLSGFCRETACDYDNAILAKEPTMKETPPGDTPTCPDAAGRFGRFGGQYVPETLMVAVRELDQAYAAARVDSAYRTELEQYLTNYVGRPSPVYYAARLSEQLGVHGST